MIKVQPYQVNQIYTNSNKILCCSVWTGLYSYVKEIYSFSKKKNDKKYLKFLEKLLNYELNSQFSFLINHWVIVWLLIYSCSRIHFGYLQIAWSLITRLTSCLGSCNSSRSLIPFQSLIIFILNFFFSIKTFFLHFLLLFLFLFWLFLIFTLFFPFVSSSWSFYFRWWLFFFFLFFFYGCTSCFNSKPLIINKRRIKYPYDCCNFIFLIGK